MPKNKTYSSEFKAEAVRLVMQENLLPAKVAQDLGISHTALANWIKKANPSPAGGSPSADQLEIQRLRKEIRVLQMEREILKKAAAFFAKESQ